MSEVNQIILGSFFFKKKMVLMLQLVPELSVYATVSLSAQGSGSFYLRQEEGGDMNESVPLTSSNITQRLRAFSKCICLSFFFCAGHGAVSLALARTGGSGVQERSQLRSEFELLSQ